MSANAKVQVDIGVQVKPQNSNQGEISLKWCYILVAILGLETLATFLINWY